MSRAFDSTRLAPVAARMSRGLRSFNSWGEDLVLREIFQDQGPGTYVDIGANHPTTESLTHMLSRAGWCGYNIDASVESIEKMRFARPRDRHLVAAIGVPGETASFVEYASSGLSSADPTVIKQWTNAGNAPISRTEVRLRSLTDVFTELGVPSRFQLLNVDIEGFDEAALRSNNWDSFRPEVIAVEDPLAAIGSPESTAIGRLLTELGYVRIAALPPTSVFVEPEIVERVLRHAGAEPKDFFTRRLLMWPPENRPRGN